MLGGIGFFSPSALESILLDQDGSLVVNVTGFEAPGLVRFDPSTLQESVISELPLCNGEDIEFVVVPEAAAGPGVSAAFAALALLARKRARS